MPHLLVLGSGWVGSAVSRAATGRIDSTTLDPPFEPALRLRDEAATRELQRIVESLGVTQIINACGMVRGTRDEIFDANLEFPRWICDALLGLANRDVRLVHIGSASEYGDPGSAAPVTEHEPSRALGDYAESKAAGTQAVIDARAAGLNATVARLFNLVDSPIPAVSPIHAWVEDLRAIATRRSDTDDLDGTNGSTVTGDGSIEVWWPPTLRDFVTLDDAARALLDLVDVSDMDCPPVVNVCSGTGLAFGDIAAALAAGMGLEVEIHSLDRPGIEAVIGDPSALESVIGWKPEMSLDRLVAAVLGDP
ncbi:MAG TPA: NAD(P)-dependent oxidoreductase [Microthrixaceae bacterium]|nr:NAD(P)-dependent oxidoreductase [Microthrixaceae bacterium]